MKLALLADLPLVRRSRVIRPDYDLRAIHCDSRRADRATGFVAVRGLQEDGHRYLESALAAGAPALFLSDPDAFARLEEAPPDGVGGVFLVAPERRVLAELAVAVWGAPSRELAVLGITGTNGKTTVAHLVAQVSAALGRPCGNIGTLGMTGGGAVGLTGDTAPVVPTGHTTPEAPDIQGFLRACVEAGVDTVAMEATSIGIALERTWGVRFRAAAFTNLTPEHLDFHPSLEAYRDTKFRLFLEGEIGSAVINLDDPAGVELTARLARERPELPVATFSLADGAELGIEQPAWDGQGMRGVLRQGGERHPFRSPLLAPFNLSNILAATGLLRAAGVKLGEVAGALADCPGAPGRFERVAPALPFTVVVDYAHTPDALENALQAARGLTGGRLLVVFGCGGDRDRGKRPLMGAIAARLAERVFLTSDNPRGEPPDGIIAEIAKGIREPRGTVEPIPERRAAIHRALGEAQAGDLLLIAGKGHETTQEIGGQKFPFSDRKVVLEWAETREE